MKYILSLFIITILLSSCYNDKADKLYPSIATCDTTNSKYAANVVPILNTNCAYSGCHNSASKAAGIAYDTYTETSITVANGKLINSIKHASGTSAMPKGGCKLNDCDINKIQAWINRGALNN